MQQTNVTYIQFLSTNMIFYMILLKYEREPDLEFDSVWA